MSVTLDDIRRAAAVIAGHVVRTPAVPASRLAVAMGSENHDPPGTEIPNRKKAFSDQLVGVTAAHVIDEYRADCERTPSLVCQLALSPLDPLAAQIDIDRELPSR